VHQGVFRCSGRTRVPTSKTWVAAVEPSGSVTMTGTCPVVCSMGVMQDRLRPSDATTTMAHSASPTETVAPASAVMRNVNTPHIGSKRSIYLGESQLL